jgi:hypothetical protein
MVKAKKTAAKKTAAKKAAPARAAKKAAPARAAKAAKKAAKPKGEQLELIKGVRYTDLDRLCRQIGENRDEVNELKRSGADLEQSAMKALRLHGVTGYNYAGVTLMIVEGDDKLRVIKARDGQASQGGSGALNQPADPDAGTGQQAGNIADALTDHDDEDAER